MTGMGHGRAVCAKSHPDPSKTAPLPEDSVGWALDIGFVLRHWESSTIVGELDMHILEYAESSSLVYPKSLRHSLHTMTRYRVSPL